MALVALLLWWTNNALMPTIASGLASVRAKTENLDLSATTALKTAWRTEAATWFNLGGLVGTLLTIPIAKVYGRKPMYIVYLLVSAASIFLMYGPNWPPETRFKLYGLVGLSVFGMFGSFTFYLPELFPTRLRATGAGFCYNAGRVITAGMAIFVSYVASQGANAVDTAIRVLFWAGSFGVLGLLTMPWVIETKGRELAD